MMTENLKIIDVFDRGVPGREGVSIRVQDFCDLGHYWMGIGVRHSSNEIFPINDHLFWLGRGLVHRGDWVFIYTGLGEPRSIDLASTESKLFSLHWKRDKVLFEAEQVFPYLINAAFVGLPEKMEPNVSGVQAITSNTSDF